jgi:hypothetical protein
MVMVWQRSRRRLRSALVSAGFPRKSCQAGYGRFNAAHIFTRTLIPESPSFQPFLVFVSPHKGAGFQGRDQLIARAEASRPQLRCHDGLERFELNRWICACVDLGCLQVCMP